MGNENLGTVHALTAAARRPARYRRLVRRTYYIFPIHYSLKMPGIRFCTDTGFFRRLVRQLIPSYLFP